MCIHVVEIPRSVAKRLRRPDAANRHRLAAGSAGQVRRLAAVGGSTPGHHGAIGLAAEKKALDGPGSTRKNGKNLAFWSKAVDFPSVFLGCNSNFGGYDICRMLRCYSYRYIYIYIYIYIYVLTNLSFNFIYVFFHSSICGCAATMIGWRLHWHPLGRNPFPW